MTCLLNCPFNLYIKFPLSVLLNRTNKYLDKVTEMYTNLRIFVIFKICYNNDGTLYVLYISPRPPDGVIIITTKWWTPFVMCTTLFPGVALYMILYIIATSRDLSQLNVLISVCVYCWIYSISKHRYLLYPCKIACAKVFYHTNDFLLRKYLVCDYRKPMVCDPKFVHVKEL